MIFHDEQVRAILSNIGFRADHADPYYRLDAGETGAFSQMLRYFEAQVYLVEYAPLKARLLIPVDTQVPAWAETFSWNLYDWAGSFKIITRFADDLPTVDVIAARKIQGIQTSGGSISWSVQDLRAAAKMGLPLDLEKGKLARRASENKLDSLSVTGDDLTGLPGFTNNANVPILSAPGTLTGNWLGGATPAQILADLHALANAIPINTLDTHAATALVLPLAHYQHCKITTLNNFNDKSIIDVFLSQSETIKSVTSWSKLDTADGSGGPMAIAYEKATEVVRMIIASEFNMLPPQPKNLAFVVPCEMRVGGISWRYPFAACYGVGI